VAGLPLDTLQLANLAGTHQAGACTNAAEQTFDPDTKLIVWQHRNFETSQDNFVGGWIRIGAASPPPSFAAGTSANPLYLQRDDAVTKLEEAAVLPTVLSVATKRALLIDLCSSMSALNGSVTDARGNVWRRCDGWVELRSGSATEATKTLNRILDVIVDRQGRTTTPDTRCNGKSGAELASCVTIWQTAWTNDRNGWIGEFINTARRIRQYTDAGKQDATLHTELNSIPGSGAPYYTEFINRIATLRAQVTSLGTAISSQSAWGYRLDLAEMPMPVTVANGFAYDYGLRWSRFSGFLRGDVGNGFLPIVKAPGSPNTGFALADRKLRRLGAGGSWQDGYSRVRLWYSDSEVHVCNAFDRFASACFLRDAVGIPSGDAVTAFRPAAGNWWVTFGTWNADSIGHPRVLGSYYCTAPNVLPAPKDTDRVTAFKTASNAPGAVPNAKAFALRLVAGSIPSTAKAIKAEVEIFKEIASQVREEPYRMIERLVLDRRDYRDLLKGDYTYGTACLASFYKNQGLYLPPNSNAAETCTAGGPETQFKTNQAIPLAELTAAMGAAGPAAVQNSTSARTRMWTLNGTLDSGVLPPRLYSGIVTMPAFLTPVATKARGTAARFFTRLLCTEPNFYDPLKDPAGGQSKLDLHRSFVSGRKHLREECILCHRNLDPLASALSWGFRGLLIPDPANPGEFLNTSGGEGATLDIIGELDQRSLGGTQNGALPATGLTSGGGPKGRGAFMGQSVEGIQELAAAVADSDQFAGCVTETAFTYVFGRKPQLADVDALKDFKLKFKGELNYRYLDLLKTMVVSDHFQRPN